MRGALASTFPEREHVWVSELNSGFGVLVGNPNTHCREHTSGLQSCRRISVISVIFLGWSAQAKSGTHPSRHRKMRRVILPLGVGLSALTTHYVFKREMRHHDAAFNQMMWELWENPDRKGPASDDPRIRELQEYLESGFFNVLWNEPPFNALDRFGGVSVEEYNNHCLEIATCKVERAMRSLEKD